MKRYLPFSVLVTAVVIAAPAVLVWVLVPVHGAPALLGALALTTVVSLGLARGAAGLWTRHIHSGDLVFADLMLWGLVRRMRIERRILEARRAIATPADGLRREDRVRALERLSELLAARDASTLGHTRRVARHASQIATAMHLPPEQIARIRLAASVHDIGKVNTPREILNKPIALSPDEFSIIRRHPDDGATMVAALDDGDVAAMVRYHHERMDGSGYPAGLRGAEIPVGARVIAVADTFDAITSSRPYRTARRHQDAIDILHAEAGRSLDPEAVDAFDSYYSAQRSVAWWAIAAAGPGRLIEWLIGAATSGSAAIAGQSALAVGGAALVLGTTPSPAKPPPRVAAPPARVTAASRAPATTITAAAPAVSTTPHVTLASSASTTTHTTHKHKTHKTHHHKPSAGSKSGGSGTGSGGGGATTSKPGGSSTHPSAGGGTTNPATPTAQPAAASPVSTPTVKTPAVSVPSVSVPKLPSTPVKTPVVPAVQTPAVTVAPVTVSPATVDPGDSTHLPSVTTPAVSVDPVTVGPITTPKVTIPPLHLP